MQMLVLGRTGTGKTFRVNRVIEEYKGKVLFCDPTFNFQGIQDIRQITNRKIDYINLDFSNNDFDVLVEYLFQLYQQNKYPHRLLLVIDEADLLCRTFSDCMERIATKSRRFFDVIYISQRPSLLRTTNGYVVATQCDRYMLFAMRDIDYNVCIKHFGLEITDAMKEFLAEKYNYIITDGMQYVGYDKVGKAIKTFGGVQNVARGRGENQKD